jgi:hypothetical protein
MAQSNHANSEGTNQMFNQESKIKQKNFSQNEQLDVLWLQVGCALSMHLKCSKLHNFKKNL